MERSGKKMYFGIDDMYLSVILIIDYGLDAEDC